MSEKEIFFELIKAKRCIEDVAMQPLLNDIEYFQEETDKLLNIIEKWFENTSIECYKLEHPLTEGKQKTVCYKVSSLLMINGDKCLHIMPIALYGMSGVKGCLLATLHQPNHATTFFELKLNDRQTNDADWSIIDSLTPERKVPFDEENFFKRILPLA